MSRFLLIEPPYYRILGQKRGWMPFGLLQLAEQFKTHGCECFVYNADADFSVQKETVLTNVARHFRTDELLNPSSSKAAIFAETFNVITAIKPTHIGISVKSDCVPVVLDLIEFLKKVYDAPLILGGPHFDISEDYTLFQGVSTIVKGEAEAVVPRLLDVTLSGTSPVIISSPPVQDLDSLPIPTLESAVFSNDYPIKLRKQLVSTSRGCPFRCSFCYKNVDMGNSRYLSGERLASIIDTYISKYGITKFYFVDDTFGMRADQLRELEHIKKVNHDFSWSCMSHVAVLTADTIKAMKVAGCSAVHLGIESGSDRMLKMLNKYQSVKSIVQCSDSLHDLGIEIKAFLMVGLPYEDDSDVDATVQLIRRISPDEITAQAYQPYPSTELFKLMTEKKPFVIDWRKYSKCYGNSSFQEDIGKSEKRIKDFLSFCDDWNGVTS